MSTPAGAASIEPATPGAVGTVVEIYTAPAAAAPPVRRTAVEALAGRGLTGDRYAERAGTFSRDPRYPTTGRHLTLIAAEALEHLAREAGIGLPDGAHRRNLVTRGLDPVSLLGKRFRVGAAECVGIRPCPPCAHLESLTQEGVMRALAHTGGLRAEILAGGAIREGDPIVLLGDATS